MVTFIRQWMAQRELNALASLPNFSAIEPEKVTRILHTFATITLICNRPDVDSRNDTQKITQYPILLFQLFQRQVDRHQRNLQTFEHLVPVERFGCVLRNSPE